MDIAAEFLSANAFATNKRLAARTVEQVPDDRFTSHYFGYVHGQMDGRLTTRDVCRRRAYTPDEPTVWLGVWYGDQGQVT